MDDERQDKRGGSCAIFAALALIVLVSGYPLSAGPVDWAFQKGYLGGGAARFTQAFYAPLIWLMANCEWFQKLANWYISLWR